MKKILVIGAARSGSAVCKLLVKHHYDVYLTDQKKVAEKEELEALGVHVYDEGHPDLLKKIKYEFVVKNPGIPYRAPLIHYFVEKQVKIYTEIEVAYWFANKFQYGAITGTNGKTTITSILYELLKYNQKASVAGNIGTPLSEVALLHEEEERDIALELSNFQLLGCEKFHPHVAVVCNLSPDHLDYMNSLEEYYISKMKIYENQTIEDYFLRNCDDVNIMKYAKDIPSTIIDFSLVDKNVDLYIKDNAVYLHNTKLFDIKILKIVGKHNLSNAMVAACMAYKLGVSIPDIQDGLMKFKSVEHRLEYVCEVNGVKFYNDSKATNPEAVVPALQAFDENVILLAGGYDKKLSFDILKPYNSHVKHCFAFGETKKEFKKIFTNVSECLDMKEAIQSAIQLATKKDIILLSPACASYDQFKSYEQRGEIFKEYVLQYIKDYRG